MFIAVFLPLFAALYIAFSALFKRPVRAWAIGTAVLGFSALKMSAMVAKTFFKAKVFSSFVMPFLSWDGVPYAWRLHFDRAELFLAVFIVAAALLCLVFSRRYIPDALQNRFVCFMLMLTFSALLCLGAKNMFQFFAGWDMAVLFSYLLLVLFHEKLAVRRSGIRFLIGHMLTDLPLLFLFFALWRKTGLFLVPPFIGDALFSFTDREAAVFALLLLGAASAKMMFFGSHVLLPDTAEMPVPALAFALPAVSGSLGIYLLYHFFPLIGRLPEVRTIFTLLGAVTSTAGVLFALNQMNIKTLLACVLMSQTGFVLAAFGLSGNALALYTFAAVMIPFIGLFLCAGSVIHCLWGEEDILKMGGLRTEKPYTFWSMWILCFCCVGFPYLGTYGARQDLFAAVFQQGGRILPGVFVLLSFLTAAALGRLMYYVFYAPSKVPAEIAIKIRQVSFSMAFPLTVLTLVSLFQDELLEQSILPELTKMQSLEVLASALFGCAGFIPGIRFFRGREARKTPSGRFARAFSQFCARGFYLSELYAFAFVRPLAALSRKLWLYGDVGLVDQWGLNRIPDAVLQTAEGLKKAHTGRLHDSLIWGVSGFFILLLSLAFMLAGR